VQASIDSTFAADRNAERSCSCSFNEYPCSSAPGTAEEISLNSSALRDHSVADSIQARNESHRRCSVGSRGRGERLHLGTGRPGRSDFAACSCADCW
jgi:hypothetical protein